MPRITGKTSSRSEGRLRSGVGKSEGSRRESVRTPLGRRGKPLEPGVRRERHSVPSADKPARLGRKGLDVAGAPGGEHHDRSHAR
jgi:hypothetical protein